MENLIKPTIMMILWDIAINRRKYQISWSLPLYTFTTSFFSFSFPLCLQSIEHLWFSGSLCPLQYTKPHLHSMPSRPTFLLQSKHRLRSFCSFFSVYRLSYSIAQSTSVSATLTGVSVRKGDFSRISSFFEHGFFLSG